MNDSIEKYLNKSKQNLNTILSKLETNIEFLDNNLWDDYQDVKEIIKKIIDIYYDKYYLYTSQDYKKINKYIKFSNKINRKLKTILLSIIEYYESVEEESVLKEKESSILYLTVLIYVSLILYEKDFNLINTPKTIEKVINNIIDNFARIRFRKEKDLISLIDNIKDVIEENNTFNRNINELNNEESHNTYISINKNNKYYKVIYDYNIKSLIDYEEKDINIVNKKKDINKILTKISYDICYYTMFKLMKNGLDYILLFSIEKDSLIDNDTINYLINRNKEINNNIKLLVNYNDLRGDYDLLNILRSKDIDIFIEVLNPIETDNYNMFMDIKNVVVPEEFLYINEKYLEIWKDMNMNFIIKNLGTKLNEKSLISGK